MSGDLGKHSDYFGTGESFLYKLSKESGAIYGSTLDNLYYLFCDATGIGFGSDPHFGLFIEQSLVKGSSHACKTFSNDVLTNQTHFVIQKLEVDFEM